MKLKDRHGRVSVLGPTHEEVVTELISAYINSYKQLPLNLYQIQTKFRDEYRPRFGLLRVREFMMKDAYSFHANVPSLDETYEVMYRTYEKIFTRCGIPYVVVEAEAGPIGGSASHEFVTPCSAGEDTIVTSDKNNYAANVEKAETGRRPISDRFREWGLRTQPQLMAGLGPFRLKQYQQGEGLVLERNPYYWKKDSHGTALPYLNEILFRQVGNEESQVLRFMGGEGDLLNRLSAKSFALLEKDASARQLDLRDLGAGPEYNFLFFNLNPPGSVPSTVAAKQTWFRDARFRRAISLSIDRGAMVRLVYGGRGTALATHVTPGIRLWNNAAIPPPVRSLAEARKLLNAAGFRLANDQTWGDKDGRPVEFTILVSSSNQQRAQMASMLQQDLKELGITSQVAPLEPQTLQDRVLRSKNYEVCLFGLAFGDADPGSEMNVWPSSGPTHLWSPSQLKPGSEWEAEIDHLMRQQMATQGYAARKKLYDRVQEIEARETPIVSLLSPNVLVAARRRVGNFRPAVLDHYTLWNAEELFLRPGPGDKK